MKKHITIILAVLCSLVFFMGCKNQVSSPPKEKKEEQKKVVKKEKSKVEFVIKTEKGKIKGELFPEVAPNTVLNFVTLAKKGFYNGLIFHRVVPGFVIQGGDPKGTGTGGPGYCIPAEFNKKPHILGTIAMARAQHPDSAGSQFYICIGEGTSISHLDGNYTVFGQVKEGLPVALKIEKGNKIKSIEIIGKLPKEIKGKSVKKSTF